MSCNDNVIKERMERLRDKWGEAAFKEKLIGTNPGQVSRQSYDHWMRGDRKPSAENIITICRMFDCSSNWLLGMDPPESYSPAIEDRAITEKTGLSSKSIGVLEYANGTPLSDPRREDNKKIIAFINRALEEVYFDIQFQKEIIESNPENRVFVSLHNCIFVHLEDYVTGSGEEGAFPFGNGRINKDFIFRYVALENVKDILKRLAKDNNTPVHTQENDQINMVGIKQIGDQ